jgi:hypothetical protein
MTCQTTASAQEPEPRRIGDSAHRNLGSANNSAPNDLQQQILRSFQSMSKSERERLLKAFQNENTETLPSPESFSPQQRKAIEDLMRSMKDQNDNGQAGPTPPKPGQANGTRPNDQGGSTRNKPMPDNLQEILKGLQKQQGGKSKSLLEKLMKDPDLKAFVKDFAKSMGGTESEPNPFPWLKDPRFPSELIRRGQERTFLDDWAKKVTSSNQLNDFLKKGLKWRRENIKNDTKKRKPRNPNQTRSPGGTRTNPQNSRGRQRDSVFRRLTNLAPTSSNGLSRLGWNLPRFPRFFGRSTARLRSSQTSQMSFQGIRTPRFDPTIFLIVFLGAFSILAASLIWGKAVGRQVENWYESTVKGGSPRDWPTSPEAMQSNDQFVENFLHLNSSLYPHRRWNHRQLQEQLSAAAPQVEAEIESLISAFEKTYYRQNQRTLTGEELSQYSALLRSLLPRT